MFSCIIAEFTIKLTVDVWSIYDIFYLIKIVNNRMKKKDSYTSSCFLAGNAPWMPYKYHTLFLQAVMDTMQLCHFWISASVLKLLYMGVNLSTHKIIVKTVDLLKQIMCLNSCNSKVLNSKKLFIVSISSGLFHKVSSDTVYMNKSLFSMLVAAYKCKGMIKT